MRHADVGGRNASRGIADPLPLDVIGEVVDNVTQLRTELHGVFEGVLAVRVECALEGEGLRAYPDSQASWRCVCFLQIGPRRHCFRQGHRRSEWAARHQAR